MNAMSDGWRLPCFVLYFVFCFIFKLCHMPHAVHPSAECISKKGIDSHLLLVDNEPHHKET